MERFTIKQTKSLSPLSFAEVDAEVVYEDGNIYLEKQDENGKKHKTVVEKDYDFYRLMTKDKVTTQVAPHAIDLYVSSECNLKCPVCYEDVGGKEQLTLEEMERLLANHENRVVVLMGREPTCRKDIVDVIRVAGKQNRVCLLTNGIKLANYDYVMRLKEAGLDTITFSFNGFDDEIYRQMNGRPLLDVKLKGLENAKRAGIKTCLSATLARGVNEGQIKELTDYCFDNRSFIFELRIRSVTSVGRHVDVPPYCMSEMVDMVAGQLHIDRDAMLKEQAFWEEVVEELKFVVPSSIRRFARTRPCSMSFHVSRSSSGYSCLGGALDLERLEGSRLKKAALAYQLVKAYGPRYIMQNAALVLKLAVLWKQAEKIPFIWKEPNTLMIALRSWPNVYNIDLEENKKCPTLYYKKGQFLPFCYANILEGHRPVSVGHP